jgi:coenzyme Q-binding protein COQ10
MARYQVSRLLPYTPDQVFALVGDVERYPEFVPWITAMHTGPARQEGEGISLVDAEASVGFSFLREAFATRVRRDAGERRINVSLISGPFRRLENTWLFRPHPKGCEVGFDIDFQFKAKMLDLLLKANFGYAVDKLIACFEARARELYGEGGSATPGVATRAALAPS